MSSKLRKFVPVSSIMGKIRHTLIAAALLLPLLANAALAMTVAGFTPAGAPPNTWITVLGTGFTGATSVKFNGIAASFGVTDDTHISAYVPSSATTGPITVSNGVETVTSAANFFVGNTPYISNVTPYGGAGGMIVTINGSYFSNISSVKFNGTSAAFTVNSSNQIATTVPLGGSTGNVTVTNPAGTGEWNTFYYPPTITTFAPAGGMSGTSVTVYGTNFNIVNNVTFNGVNANFSVQENTRLIVTVPGGATTGPIRVSSFAGAFTSTTSFFVGPAPTVNSVSPIGGPPGTSLTITGSNFSGITGVTIGGANAPFSVSSSNEIQATVPGNAVTGALSVSNPTGTGTWGNAFYVGEAPAVTSFSPASGPVGSAVNIFGNNFLSATSVRFGAVEAIGFVVYGDDEILATVPVGASTSHITVENPAGFGSSTASFAVSPQVLASTPMSAPASSAVGTLVDVYGRNFTGAYEVALGGVPAAFIVANDEHLSLWIAAGATTGPISVRTPAGVGTSAFQFEIVTFTPPPHTLYSSWPTDLYTNVAVSTHTGDDDPPVTCSDSTGGVYVAWKEYDAGTYRVRLQRLTAYGERSLGWPVDGIVISEGDESKQNVHIIADRVGGVLMCWDEIHGGQWDVYATRVNPLGAVVLGWLPGGTPVCTAYYHQLNSNLCSDGSSGVYIAWQDLRNSSTYDIYVQRLMGNGQVASGWDAQGIAIATTGYSEYSPALASDPAGGVYLCWRDDRDWALLQRVLPNGLIASGWPSGGQRAGGYNFSYPPASLMPDGAGGVLVGYAGSYPILCRYNSDASVAANWPGSGKLLNSANYSSVYGFSAVPDGKGGAFAFWAYNNWYTLVAQHVANTGSFAGGWPLSGFAFRSESNQSYYPTSAPDGSGGAYVTWMDNRTGEFDIYAQRFTSANSSTPAWATNGVLVAAAIRDQRDPAITFAGTPGAIITWHDYRSGAGWDTYAQNITLAGKPGNLEPHLLSVRDLANDQGGKVRITWQRSLLDTIPTIEISTYGIWRQVTGEYAMASLAAGKSSRMATDTDEPAPGLFLRTIANAQSTWWEGLASIPARGQLTYSYVAATLADSGAAGGATEVYMVDAHASFGSYYWSSDPDSGHSVDNLAPAAPAAFVATFLPGSTKLHWHRNVEHDLAEYRIYRGTDALFDPSPATLVGSTTDTAYTDTHAGYAYYKLVAVDVHANASAAAIALPPSELGVPGEVPVAFALGNATPNPAAGRCMLSLALPRASRVTASVYDAAGRRVRALSSREWPAGAHSLAWDLRNQDGAAVSDGLYFVRVEAGGFTWTKRVAVLH